MASTLPETMPAQGRPRSKELDDRIIAVTLDLLTQMTYERMTIAEIARLCGCPKSSIYRRYTDIRAIVVAAIEHDMAEDIFPVTDRGSLSKDIAAFIATVAEAISDRRARILTSLIFTMRDDPTLAAPLMRRLGELHSNGWKPIIERAVKRGELTEAALSLEICADAAAGLLFQRILLQRQPVTGEFLEEISRAVLLPSLEAYRTA